MRGVVAAGHPVTARAGADALREGGNAVDAAVAAVLMSWVAESPLTGPGAGGFMLVHTAGGDDHLLDFFVAAPGRGMSERDPAELIDVCLSNRNGLIRARDEHDLGAHDAADRLAKRGSCCVNIDLPAVGPNCEARAIFGHVQDIGKLEWPGSTSVCRTAVQ